MTETDWLTGTDVKKLLKYVHKRASERKRRFFAAACWCRVRHLSTDPRLAAALITIERYADGAASDADLSRAEETAFAVFEVARDAELEAARLSSDVLYAAACAGVGWDIAEYASTNAVAAVRSAADRRDRTSAGRQESLGHLALARDIFGNPFRPVAIAPEWLTSDVRALATGIYDDRAFDRMPILADALQDAGCDSDDLLSHLRDPNAAHVRGCWALDLVLGKG